MRAVIQRVENAHVSINHTITASIKKGLCVFVAIHATDTQKTIAWMTKKILNLRIFEDTSQKMNESIKDQNLELLIIPQFTLYANCQKGTRPNFTESAPPQIAEPLFNDFITYIKTQHRATQSGIFAASMNIQLTNNGPVTLILDAPTLQ